MKRYAQVLLLMFMILTCIASDDSFAGGGGKGGDGGSDPAPAYYSFEDLRSELKIDKYWFANMNKPANAYVDLGYNMSRPASIDRTIFITDMVSRDPKKYRVDTSVIMSNWNDSIENPFNWNKLNSEMGDRGDLVFIRANGKAPDFVKNFSNWTHVAIIDSINEKKVFESMPDSGVKVNYAPDTWGFVTYYTCKRIEAIPYSQRINALNAAEQRYTGLPYFPKVSTVIDRFTFLVKWADKNNIKSMYCSKLVYHTFKDYVDWSKPLDTNNTCADVSANRSDLIDKTAGAPLFAWIGVSPDDIYYSNALGSDYCYSDNINYL